LFDDIALAVDLPAAAPPGTLALAGARPGAGMTEKSIGNRAKVG
jgi:hypothetical protein